MKMKSAPIIVAVVVVLALVAGFFFYRSNRHRAEGRTEIAELVPQLDKAKNALLKDYQDRLTALVDWQTALAKDPKKYSPALVLNENIKRSGDLKFDTPEEAERFDFVQNQVSEMITKYIAKDPGSSHMRDVQKIEEKLNRDRREYHKVAFEITDRNKQYRLHEVNPVIFSAERVLREHEKRNQKDSE